MDAMKEREEKNYATEKCKGEELQNKVNERETIVIVKSWAFRREMTVKSF